jgi:hypothetical protein
VGALTVREFRTLPPTCVSYFAASVDGFVDRDRADTAVRRSAFARRLDTVAART